jgi:hypothetical protein
VPVVACLAPHGLVQICVNNLASDDMTAAGCRMQDLQGDAQQVPDHCDCGRRCGPFSRKMIRCSRLASTVRAVKSTTRYTHFHFSNEENFCALHRDLEQRRPSARISGRQHLWTTRPMPPKWTATIKPAKRQRLKFASRENGF